MPTDDGYLDIRQLARYSGLSERSIRRHMHDPAHPLPHHLLTLTGQRRGRLVFSRKEFDHWVRTFAGQPSSELVEPLRRVR